MLNPSAKELGIIPEEAQPVRERQQTKFEVFFDAPYNELKSVMAESIQPNSRIIDIGAHQGGLEDYMEAMGGKYSVECVDMDSEALGVLESKKYENVETSVVQSDANQFVENRAASGDQDVILLSATLHEINDVADQRGYLQHFFEKARGILGPNGKIIIGDFYYPDSVTDEEFNSFREYQRQAINHADARNKFVKPDLIKETAEEVGFVVESFREIRAVKELDRRYYVIVLKKVEQTGNEG